MIGSPPKLELARLEDLLDPEYIVDETTLGEYAARNEIDYNGNPDEHGRPSNETTALVSSYFANRHEDTQGHVTNVLRLTAEGRPDLYAITVKRGEGRVDATDKAFDLGKYGVPGLVEIGGINYEVRRRICVDFHRDYNLVLDNVPTLPKRL